jgi:hypothetical protein
MKNTGMDDVIKCIGFGKPRHDEAIQALNQASPEDVEYLLSCELEENDKLGEINRSLMFGAPLLFFVDGLALLFFDRGFLRGWTVHLLFILAASALLSYLFWTGQRLSPIGKRHKAVLLALSYIDDRRAIPALLRARCLLAARSVYQTRLVDKQQCSALSKLIMDVAISDRIDLEEDTGRVLANTLLLGYSMNDLQKYGTLPTVIKLIGVKGIAENQHVRKALQRFAIDKSKKPFRVEIQNAARAALDRAGLSNRTMN